MFERFQLPDVANVARRTMVSALVVGVLGLVVLLLFSQNWAALGFCIGIGMGIGNFRLIVQSVVKVGRRAGANKRRPLAMNTLARLMAMTVVALVLAWVEPPLGLAMIAGLAIFQFLLLANVTRSMLRAGVTAGSPGGLALLFGSSVGDLGDLGDAGDPAPGALGPGRRDGGAPADSGDAGGKGDVTSGGGAA